MEDFREPPPDPGGDSPPEEPNGSPEPRPESPSEYQRPPSEPVAEPFDATDDADTADADTIDAETDDTETDDAAIQVLRRQLAGVVDDSQLIAAAEASRLRGIYAMLQDALEHPRVFIPAREGVTRTSLTGEEQGWVRSALAQEIGAAMGITKGQAGGLITDAEQLCESLPATLDALEAGQLASRHAAAMIRQSIGLDVSATAVFEAEALPKALTQSPTQFASTALRTREELFPDTITDRKTEAAKQRRVDCYGTPDGMGTLSIHAPIEIVQSISTAAKQTARALKAAGDERTLAQIETDALVDAIMNGFTADEKPGVGATGIGADRLSGIRPTVYVTVPVMTLLGHTEQPAHLDGYGPIDPDTARKLAAQAPSFTRLLTHPETGAVLSVGRDSYAVPADLRRAVELRDETCVGIGCNRPATVCDLDHRNDWQKGGETSLANLDAECKQHHMLKHHTMWRIHKDKTGDIVWTSPLGHTYQVPRVSNVQFATRTSDVDDAPTTIRKELPDTPPF